MKCSLRNHVVAGVVCCLGIALTATVRGQTPAEFAQTAAFAAAHQNKDGGFAAKAGGPSSLGSTNSGLRVLHYVGGSVPDILACIRYVKSCRDAGGGFAPAPGGKPDVVVTAIGLMAASELKIADQNMIQEAIAYLGKNAKSFEEIRMAIAGLEAVRAKSPDFTRWNEEIQAKRNPDGTFGDGPGQPYATGGAAAAILRMGLELDKRDAVATALKSGQRADGGWSKDGGNSDLGSTYRIMRAIYMMHERPDLDRLLSFVARCRQSDGSYASAPGGTGDLGGNLYGHDRDPLGTAVVELARRRRDGRLHAAGQGQRSRRMGGRHPALVGQGRRADRPLSGSGSQRVSGDDSLLRRLHPLTQFPHGRRHGQ